jgi:hypothetical protein
MSKMWEVDPETRAKVRPDTEFESLSQLTCSNADVLPVTAAPDIKDEWQ